MNRRRNHTNHNQTPVEKIGEIAGKRDDYGEGELSIDWGERQFSREEMF